MTLQGTPDTTESIELQIGGMTCASCAMRIEKKLNKLDGVTATVNYATETGQGRCTRGRVGRRGAHRGRRDPPATPPRLPRAKGDASDRRRGRRGRRDGAAASRLVSTRARSRVPVIVLAMIPTLQFDGLAVALAHPRRARGDVGRVAVPPGGLGQPPARRRHHGHPDLGRRDRRLRVVAVRAVPRLRRRDRHDPRLLLDRRAGRRRPGVPRGRGRRHRVHPRRPLLRGPGQATLRRRPACPAGARRQGRRRAPRRRRGPHPDRRARGRRPLRRPPRREDRHRRNSSRRAPRPSTHRCSPASRSPSRSPPATPSPGRPSTPAGASWSGRPGSGPTPSSPRSPGSSRTPRPARRRCSASPTGSRPSSCPSSSHSQSPPSASGWRAGAGRGSRVHRRRRRADHRLPVRPRPGHADRTDGRHRPGRPARHPHQGARGARVAPAGSTRSCSTRPAPSPPAA